MKARNSSERKRVSVFQLSTEYNYSEQKQSEKMEEWLALALSAAQVGAWVWELKPETKEIFRTELYDRINGIPPNSTWTRDNWLTRIHPDDRDSTHHKMEQVLSGKQNEYNAEYRIVMPDHSIRWVHSWGKSICNSEGNPIMVTGIVKDVTDRKRLEQERDQYIATLTHDLRNPLAAARANAEVILRFPGQIEQEDRMLEKIVSNIERADRVIQDLLDSSRLQSGVGLNLKMEKSDLKEIATEFVKELGSLYENRVSLRVSGKTLGYFEGTWSKEGIHRILENLTGNAIKYGAENGPVNVELDCNEHEVTLSVHNYGNIIPIEDQKILFEPYQRAKSAEQGSKRGWGLGLTLVRGIAKAHGGRVELSSTCEAGTTFAVKFPLGGAGPLL